MIFNKKLTMSFGFVFMSFFGISQINPSDGCVGVPTLPVNSSCVNNNYTLPGTYSNGGLVNASCAANSDRDDGWYAFVATASEITIEEVSTPRRHLISVWDACGGGTELGCDQNLSGVTNTINLTGLTVGNTYYVQIHRRSGSAGASMSGTICIYETPVLPPVPEDCEGGTTVCSSSSFSGNSNGSGNVADLDASNRGCLAGNEHESSWYYFSPATSGTFVFTIVTSVDYDFAVWGPMASVTCPPVGDPARCSYSGVIGNTGLQIGAGDNTEGAGGDAVVNEINGLAGEIYILCIDNYTSDGSGFDLNWSLSNGGTLNCTPLPVEMSMFQGFAEIDHNLLSWETKSESESKEFIIERSFDGEEFEPIGKVNAAQNSSSTIKYSFEDFDLIAQRTYYRIKMVDLDESYEYSHIISVNREDEDITFFPNPTDGSVNIVFDQQYVGSYTIVYKDLMGRSIEETIFLDGFNNEHETSALVNLPVGVYFVQITDKFGNVVTNQKIIKK